MNDDEKEKERKKKLQAKLDLIGIQFGHGVAGHGRGNSLLPEQLDHDPEKSDDHLK
jgi:hypothetical protein